MKRVPASEMPAAVLALNWAGYIYGTDDPRVFVQHVGSGSDAAWRFIAVDDDGDASWTGKPYRTHDEAVRDLPTLLHDYYGDPLPYRQTPDDYALTASSTAAWQAGYAAGWADHAAR